MEITDQNWDRILKLFGPGTRVTGSPNIPYCVLATVDEDGSPRAAPYTSLVLQENKRGFYFDEFSGHMSQNLERDRRLCVLLLKIQKWFWIKSVLLGKFDHAPGIRLMGTVGMRRAATPQEMDTFRKPLRKLRIFRGYQPLWGSMKYGRDINFESFETVKCGPMRYMKEI